MTDFKSLVETLIVKRKAGDKDFVYVYIPTSTECKGKKVAFDTFVADVDRFSKFVVDNRTKDQDMAQFEGKLKSAIMGVKYESGENGVAAAETPEEDGEENDHDVIGFNGILSASLLKRQMAVNVKSTEQDKVKPFIMELPNVEKVQNCGSWMRQGSKRYLITFSDSQSCAGFKPHTVKSPVAKLEKSQDQHWMFIRRPTRQIGKKLRERLMFARRYITGFSQDGELEREVVIIARGPYMKADKMSEYLTSSDVHDVERVRPMVTGHPNPRQQFTQMFVLFKTAAAADKFLSRKLVILGDNLQAEKASKLVEVIEKFSRDGLYGDSEASTRDPARCVVVHLFNEALKRIGEIKKFFEAEEAEEVLTLPTEFSSILDPDHIAKPALLLVFPSPEKVKEVLDKIAEVLNVNKTEREWVYALSLAEELKERKNGLFPRTDCPDTMEQCKDCFQITEESVKYAPPYKKQEKKVVEPKVEVVVKKEAGVVVENKKDMGEWIICSLSRNNKQVTWHSKDSQEIGRYFFENHLNVLEIKMRNNSDIVYVRFTSPQDSQVFVALAYVLFLGVPVERKRFNESPGIRDNNLRQFLGGNRVEHTNGTDKGAVVDDEDKVGILFTGFKEKFTNKEMFERINFEINVEQANIKNGHWAKDAEANWFCLVNLRLEVEKITELVVRWNDLNVSMKEAVIKGELHKTVKKEKKPKNDRGKKRKSESGTWDESKKARNFLENY